MTHFGAAVWLKFVPSFVSEALQLTQTIYPRTDIVTYNLFYTITFFTLFVPTCSVW